jgi:peptidoglycan hydrolase CwlO-like protein
MEKERGLSGFVQIAIAAIGVIGSLGVAWITTGAKFESELKQNQESVVTLRKDVSQMSGTLNPMIDTLGRKQSEVDQKITELNGLLQATTDKNAELERNLAALQVQIDNAKASNQALTAASAAANNQINVLQNIRSTRPRELTPTNR